MPIVKIIGGQEIELPFPEAKVLLTNWFNAKKEKRTTEPLMIKDWAGSYSQITQISMTGSQNVEYKDAHVKKINEDYLKERKRILSMSVEDRAKSLGFFRLLWWSMTNNNEIPEDVNAKAFALQKQFFTDNPKRIHPNPNIFKGVVPSNDMDLNALKVFESCLREDTHCARG